MEVKGWLVRIAPPSLPSYYSSLATRDFQSSISIEAFLRHIIWTCRASFTSNSCPLPQFSTVVLLLVDLVVVFPLKPTSPSSPSRRHPGVPSVSSPVSIWSLQFWPQLQGILYTTLDCVPRGNELFHLMPQLQGIRWTAYQDRAPGSNLEMVSLSFIPVVKPAIICV